MGGRGLQRSRSYLVYELVVECEDLALLPLTYLPGCTHTDRRPKGHSEAKMESESLIFRSGVRPQVRSWRKLQDRHLAWHPCNCDATRAP